MTADYAVSTSMKDLRCWPLFAVTVFCAASAVFADTPTDAEQTQATHEVKLNDGLARLKPFAGRWQIVAFQPDANQQWQENERSQLSFDWVLGNRLLETSGHMQNSDFRLSISYDALKSVYRLALIDNLSGVLDIYEGNFDESGTLVLTNPDYYQWRIQTTASGWEMNYHRSVDQGENYAMFGRNVLSPASH